MRRIVRVNLHEPPGIPTGRMKQAFACILGIGGSNLLYPQAHYKANLDSYTALSEWNLDGSYGSAADCYQAQRLDSAPQTSGFFQEIQKIREGRAKRNERIRKIPFMRPIQDRR